MKIKDLSESSTSEIIDALPEKIGNYEKMDFGQGKVGYSSDLGTVFFSSPANYGGLSIEIETDAGDVEKIAKINHFWNKRLSLDEVSVSKVLRHFDIAARTFLKRCRAMFKEYMTSDFLCYYEFAVDLIAEDPNSEWNLFVKDLTTRINKLK